MNDLPDPPLDETERAMLGLGTEVTSNYRCSRCRLAHPLTGAQLRRVVVQRDLGVREHHEQGVLLGQGQCRPGIQLRVARRRPEQHRERRPQRRSVGRCGLLAIGQQAAIERPERVPDPVQTRAVGLQARLQLLNNAAIRGSSRAPAPRSRG